MLIASSRMMVGATNSQAMERSERPRTARPTLGGVALATRSAMASISGIRILAPAASPTFTAGDAVAGVTTTDTRMLDLAFFLEDRSPVLDQAIQRFLGRALVGDDIVMHALLHGLQQRGIGRLLPEVLHTAHR